MQQEDCNITDRKRSDQIIEFAAGFVLSVFALVAAAMAIMSIVGLLNLADY